MSEQREQEIAELKSQLESTRQALSNSQAANRTLTEFFDERLSEELEKKFQESRAQEVALEDARRVREQENIIRCPQTFDEYRALTSGEKARVISLYARDAGGVDAFLGQLARKARIRSEEIKTEERARKLAASLQARL